MPAYDVSLRCKDCGRDHFAFLKLHLKDGPVRKQSIAEYFDGPCVPPQVEAIREHNALCPKTGRKFSVTNHSEIFLVPPKYLRHASSIRSKGRMPLSN